VALTSAGIVAQSPLPSAPLKYGFFTITFAPDGALALDGEGSTFQGTWKAENGELTLSTPMRNCQSPGRYRYRVDGTHLVISLVQDACQMRMMIVHDSTWLPEGEKPAIPERKILLTATDVASKLRPAVPAADSWPSFRGPGASGIAEKQNLPDTWDPET